MARAKIWREGEENKKLSGTEEDGNKRNAILWFPFFPNSQFPFPPLFS